VGYHAHIQKLISFKTSNVGVCLIRKISTEQSLWRICRQEVIGRNNYQTKKTMKKAIIMGASSGIGYAVAKRLIEEGWMVGLSARRLEPLQTLTQLAPERVFAQRIDVTDTEATTPLSQLIARLGGIDLYFHASGIGKQNTLLDESIEQATLATNVMGFARMVDFVFNYMADNGGGHIAIISSVAGTKGIGSAASYSASKTFQNAYIQALDQLAVKRGLPIIFTDIRPGFVDTPILTGDNYPMLMTVEHVAERIMWALKRKKRVRIIDWRYRLMVRIWRMIPNSVWRKMKIGKA